MEARDIKDQESLQAWLEDKPPEWAQLVAWRAALRVFVLVPEDLGRARTGPVESQVLTLALWRCLLISPVARKYATGEMRAAARAAARAVASYADAAAYAAYADVASYAGAAVASYADAAAARADAAAWESIRCDCGILERDGPDRLESAPLWLEHQRAPNGEPKPVIATPDWVVKTNERLADDLVGLLGPDAELISDWYSPLLSGDVDVGWSRMFAGERARTLALRKDAFWTVSDRREAETIMEDIAAALGWEKRNPWGLDPAEEAKRFIFLSHARADRPRATAVRKLLLEQGFEVWWDDDISGGDGWRDRIAEGLDKAAVVLTLWSEHSVGRDAVREEAAKAQRNRKLVHARLDRADLPYGFGETHYIDMQSWDGTASHEAWRKLAQSLRDKITPPGADDMRQRLSASSPIAMVAESGMLSPRDTPPNARPTVVNAPDLEQRILALRLTHDRLRSRVDGGHYQVPQDLRFSLDMAASAINAEQLTWYAIADGHHSLCTCMSEHDAANAWNTTLCKDLERFAERLLELRPLLQPEQVPVDKPGAKPPQPEPTVLESEIPEVEDIAEGFNEIMESDEAKAVLSGSALAIGEAGADQVENSASQPDPEKRLPILRGGLKRMVYVAGGIISAIGGGVIINLLTAPDAAATLAARLKPLYDLMVKFFM
ncbi:MAG: toll/interleukin-1 receptor domain-containing protein [Hoeflea sp.]|uniref:toll/interleukin-1 receptor domain-containing protein n=1 Tax=Hoeflea sp. TaxID=1940281 RepID=UPI0032EE91DE